MLGWVHNSLEGHKRSGQSSSTPESWPYSTFWSRLKQPSHLTEAKTLRLRARLNFPAAFSFLFYNQIKWSIFFSAPFNTVKLHEMGQPLLTVYLFWGELVSLKKITVLSFKDDLIKIDETNCKWPQISQIFISWKSSSKELAAILELSLSCWPTLGSHLFGWYVQW